MEDDDYNVAPDEESGVLAVPLACAGLRLDQALARCFPAFSRSRIQGWIKAGDVRCNGRALAASVRLAGGELLEVLPAFGIADDVSELVAEPVAFETVHLDSAIRVVNKRAGLVVHPGNGNRSGTLMNGLLHADPSSAAVPRAGIVHRLDKDTTGLMVVARTATAHAALVRQLQARSVRRLYLALVCGQVPDHGTVDAPIGRHPSVRTRMAVVPDGKPAVTHFVVRQRFASSVGLRALVECRLETGRTHQIRVHLAHIGCPLVGDSVYHPREDAGPALARQALHAWQLGLVHPESGEPCLWRAPLPDDFRQLLATLAPSVVR